MAAIIVTSLEELRDERKQRVIVLLYREAGNTWIGQMRLAKRWKHVIGQMLKIYECGQKP